MPDCVVISILKLVFAPTKMPDCVVIFYTERKSLVFSEAKRLGIPIVALVDSSMPWEYYKKLYLSQPATQHLLQRLGAVTSPGTTEMKVAPKNFRPDMVLGEGGFGKVFKGWLDEKGTWKTGIGTPIVVKKLNSEGWQGFEEWDKVERTSESESTASDEVIGVPYDNLAPLSDDIAESKQLLDKLVVVKFNGASGKNMGFSGARIRDGGR